MDSFVPKGLYEAEGEQEPFDEKAIAQCFAQAKNENLLENQETMLRRLVSPSRKG